MVDLLKLSADVDVIKVQLREVPAPVSHRPDDTSQVKGLNPNNNDDDDDQRMKKRALSSDLKKEKASIMRLAYVSGLLSFWNRCSSDETSSRMS